MPPFGLHACVHAVNAKMDTVRCNVTLSGRSDRTGHESGGGMFPSLCGGGGCFFK